MGVANGWQFVAGAYDITYGGAKIGTSKTGATVTIEYHDRPILVDEMAEGPVDSLQAGMSMFIDFDYAEYLKIEGALMAQQGGAATQGDIASQVGKLLSTLGAQLVFTPIVRTNNNHTYTFHVAVVVDKIGILLSSALREGPVTFRIYPFAGTSGNAKNGKFYTKS